MVTVKKFKTEVRRIGTSWGVYLPKVLLRELRITQDDLRGKVEVNVSVSRTASDILQMRRDKEILRMVDRGEVFVLDKERMENEK